MGLPVNKSQAKLKSYRLRFGNIKDFHGRRQTTENHRSLNTESSFDKETKKSTKLFPVKPINSVSQASFTSFQNSNPFSIFGPKPVHTHTDEIRQIQNMQSAWEPNPTQSFEQHMTLWADDFRKPFSTASVICEFDMPYCYSKEFLNQEAEKRAASALGSPPQTTLIKSSVARLVADAKLDLDRFVDDGVGFDMTRPVLCQEKSEAAVFLVADDETAQVRLRNDCAIYTSSWQN